MDFSINGYFGLFFSNLIITVLGGLKKPAIVEFSLLPIQWNEQILLHKQATDIKHFGFIVDSRVLTRLVWNHTLDFTDCL